MSVPGGLPFNPLQMLGKDKAQAICLFVAQKQADLASAIADLEAATGMDEDEVIDIPNPQVTADNLLDAIEAKLTNNLHQWHVANKYPQAATNANNRNLIGLRSEAWERTKTTWEAKMIEAGYDSDTPTDELVDTFLRKHRDLTIEAVEDDWIGEFDGETQKRVLGDALAGPISDAPARIRVCADRVRHGGEGVAIED